MSKSIRGIRYLYAFTVAVILLTAPVAASWPHGCCDGTDDCVGEGKVCCPTPDGWEPCHDGWLWNSSYCSYDLGCNLDQN